MNKAVSRSWNVKVEYRLVEKFNNISSICVNTEMFSFSKESHLGMARSIQGGVARIIMDWLNALKL